MLNRALIGAGLGLAVLGGGMWWWRTQRAPEPPPVEQAPVAEAPAPVESEPAIQYPVPEAPQAPDTPPLPAMAESDAPVAQELSGLFGMDLIAALLEPQNVIRRIVATVDGLPRAHGTDRLRPVKPLSPAFEVERVPPASLTAEERIFIGEGNAARYAPLVSLFESTDVQSMVAVYQRWYPLLQQGYEDLGYPGRYFNDRLVQVIDHLLEAPEVKGRIELTQPNVMFEYADPALEALSAGQKTLVRMGPANAARVKEKLRELRGALAAIPRPEPQAPAGAAEEPPAS